MSNSKEKNNWDWQYCFKFYIKGRGGGLEGVETDINILDKCVTKTGVSEKEINMAKIIMASIIRNFVTVTEVNSKFYKMELFSGSSLSVLFVGSLYTPIISYEPFANYLDQLLVVVSDLSKIGYYHNDVNPGNIMIDTKNNKLCLCDIGGLKAFKFKENMQPDKIGFEVNELADALQHYFISCIRNIKSETQINSVEIEDIIKTLKNRSGLFSSACANLIEYSTPSGKDKDFLVKVIESLVMFIHLLCIVSDSKQSDKISKS